MVKRTLKRLKKNLIICIFYQNRSTLVFFIAFQLIMLSAFPSPLNAGTKEDRLSTVSTIDITPPNSGINQPLGRSNSLNFEDEIVEGMNKNPFDSLTTLEKKDNRIQDRLYKKKPYFRFELKLTIREMGLLQ